MARLHVPQEKMITWASTSQGAHNQLSPKAGEHLLHKEQNSSHQTAFQAAPKTHLTL